MALPQFTSGLLKYLQATPKTAFPMVTYPLGASKESLVGPFMRSSFRGWHRQTSISAACYARYALTPNSARSGFPSYPDQKYSGINRFHVGGFGTIKHRES